MSGEFIIKDQPVDATDSFTLPPAAMSPAKLDSISRRSSRSDPTYVPASPTSPDLTARNRSSQQSQSQSQTQSRSGTATKRPLEDFDLPPPPTRTRKIIQMKPKTQTQTKSPAKSKENNKAAQTSSEPGNKDAPASKKKQPSSTSAAGRKIARKTAHSLIERRRRSKMNEEFGTLKDMIPACRGQEMHKLAILQASIDYVNYLEQCIGDLKTAGTTHTAGPPSPTSPEFMAGVHVSGNAPRAPQRPPSSVYSYSTSASPELMPGSGIISDTSPSFSPRTRMPSVHTLPDIASALPSPALGPMNQNMENLHELQGIDAEASAALLMLTRDRRGTADSINEHFANGISLAPAPSREKSGTEGPRRNGMSVRDLLIS
ncbi:hypothetical protein N7478_000854 [Penicillium angulare]|uniref:uncharacterized protein n=1 Tax=Penicillium angulare TaxID=116970 RepID=UPI00254258FF|nr:uncharacterized protein N7478_000854 [Penicillium angulare]KAJ5291603.1 hypothetical protein N7478_000854 [Penicillium angulare]